MESTPEPQAKICRNCQTTLVENAIYCSHCSQKYTTGKIPVWELIKEFFSEQLNLDSKLFKTIYALLIPGKLTIVYFEGKHKSLVSPLRTFLITAIILFAAISFQVGDQNIDGLEDLSANNIVSRAERNVAINNLDSIKQVVIDEFNDPNVEAALDSMFLNFKNVEGGKSDSTTLGRFTTSGFDENFKVDPKDITELSLDELADKYNVSNTFERYFFKQQVKALKNGSGLFQYFLGKLTFMVLLMMPFLALLLKLLYIRRGFYYVEHLIFSFHYHSFSFLIIALMVLCGKYLGDWIALLIVGINVYQFMAMKRVYQQSFFKTFIKFSLLNFLYMFLALAFLILTIMISFVLF